MWWFYRTSEAPFKRVSPPIRKKEQGNPDLRISHYSAAWPTISSSLRSFMSRDEKEVPPLPIWLVEGLVIHLTEDPWTDTVEFSQKNAPLMPLPSLHRS